MAGIVAFDLKEQQGIVYDLLLPDRRNGPGGNTIRRIQPRERASMRISRKLRQSAFLQDDWCNC